ncbi:MAG: hypothetical protein IJ877_06870 [Candidatus Gastranaerophilales bacterium]|nr:hypothetical protein [Candidatus Gastranaerophilales bacterium]
MKKYLLLALISAFILNGYVFGAKYTINTSGTVKTQGKVVQPAIKNPYSVYSASQYINSVTAKTSSISAIDIVMDYSGSMSNCIEVAKNAMSAIVSQIPESVNLGFRVFGHDLNGSNPNTNATLAKVKQIVKQKNGKYSVQTKQSPVGNHNGYCAATQSVAPVVKANSYNLLKGMNSVSVGGATPLVYALDRAVEEDFRAFSNQAKKIILITDGGENCGGDPCAYAKELAKSHPEVHIDVVLVQGRFSGLNCLANQTGGKIYNLHNLSDFSNVIQESITTPVESSATQQYEFYNDSEE